MKIRIFFLVILIGLTWNFSLAGDKKTKKHSKEHHHYFSGLVLDGAYEPIAGAEVTVEGERYYTNLDGEYEIPDFKKNSLATVSYISFKTKTVKLSDFTETVILEEED